MAYGKEGRSGERRLAIGKRSDVRVRARGSRRER